MNPAASPTPSADSLRDIVPPVRFVGPVDMVWLLAGLGLALALAGFLWWLWRRRRRAPAGPALTPRQRAAARLRELRARAGELDARAFGNEAADILRAFVTDEYRLHPQRQTSPEFLEDAARTRFFSAGEHELLREFLDGCDLLKFARTDATPAAKERLLAQATNFTEGAGAPPPLPGLDVPPPLPVGAR